MKGHSPSLRIGGGTGDPPVAREMGVSRSTVCGIGNVVPKMAVKLFNLVTVKKDVEAAWTLYKKMLPLLYYLEYASKTQKALKYAMGLCGRYSSSPKLPLDDIEQAKVDALL